MQQNNIIMYISLIRSVVVFAFLLFVMRLMGKRQLGEMQPFELVITLLVAELACIPIADTSIPLSHGVIPVAMLLALHFFITVLARKSLLLRKVISGKPMLAITPEGVDYKVLKQMNLNFNDLIEAMRGADVFYFEDVQYGIFETNGSFYAIKNDEPTIERSLPMLVIEDGKIIDENLKELRLSKDSLIRQLRSNKVRDIKSIIVMTLDDKGNVYLQEHGKKFRTTVLKVEQ